MSHGLQHTGVFQMVFDPLEKLEKIQKIVCNEDKRKYYRFRISKQYAGDVTADCVGCFLDCAFCWSSRVNSRPAEIGKFYSVEKVFKKVVETARRRKLHRVRLSGGEPTLCIEHFTKLVEIFGEKASDLTCIIETNGILIAKFPELAKLLASYPNMEVRVSIKGFDEESFERITGAEGKYFWWQIDAIKILLKHRAYAYCATMWETAGPRGVKKLMKTLLKHGVDGLELECLYRYDFVMKRIKERGIKLY